MDKFKKLIADDIEIKCPMGHSSDGTFYKDTSWIDGANQYASLLEKALQALDSCELYPNGHTNMKVKKTIAEITSALTSKA